MTPIPRRDAFVLLTGLLSILAIAGGYRLALHVTNPTTAALTFLLVVLIIAAVSSLWVAVATAVVADVCLNYFFMPPFGTLTIADPQNWVALFVFLAVGVIGSRLSAAMVAVAAERARFLEERHTAALLRQSEELKSALLASLAHDLKTPLTAIRVAASNLTASWLAEADRREQGDVILAEVERLNRLFENILEMARIDAGAVASERRWVHPREIFEAACDRVERTLKHHPVEVESESDDLVRLDPRLTAAALAHLLENAAQYTPPPLPIRVTMSVSPEGLTITVRDRGPGIAPADLPHLFDRFYRGAGARRRVSGTGMGLSIARGLLAAEGGRIWAENCRAGGAQFTIVVPAGRRTAAAEPA